MLGTFRAKLRPALEAANFPAKRKYEVAEIEAPYAPRPGPKLIEVPRTRGSTEAEGAVEADIAKQKR